jgi:hypothetical protein
MPRFHFAYCKKLDEMRQSGRWQRYVVAAPMNGLFSVNIIGRGSPKKSEEKLSVCRYCLESLRWEDFSIQNMSEAKKQSIVSSFDINKFYDKYPRDLITVIPEHTSDTAPINDYPDNWGDISQKKKKAADFRCQSPSCRIRVKASESKYLHVHHENGMKNDCSDNNLKVLCIKCHAEQPMHDHMKSLPEYEEFINLYG